MEADLLVMGGKHWRKRTSANEQDKNGKVMVGMLDNTTDSTLLNSGNQREVSLSEKANANGKFLKMILTYSSSPSYAFGGISTPESTGCRAGDGAVV